MTTLHIDFETYSACELSTYGLDNYARHETTGIHCMAFAFDDEAPKIWINPDHGIAGCPYGDALHAVLMHVKNNGRVAAHNAAFELALWNTVGVKRYGWPQLHPDQCVCTMAMAYAMSLFS